MYTYTVEKMSCTCLQLRINTVLIFICFQFKTMSIVIFIYQNKNEL